MSAPLPPEERAVRRIETAGAALVIAAARRVGDDLSGSVLDRVMAHLMRRHPRAFATLSALKAATVLIDPVDQDGVLALTVGPALKVRVVARDEAKADAHIRGPLAALLDLMEGRIDGDALFFRRELKIDGDTELVVAVRNAFDGEDMDLAADLAALFGPAERMVAPARRGVGRAAAFAARVRGYLLEPVNARLDAIERRMARYERRDQ